MTLKRWMAMLACWLPICVTAQTKTFDHIVVNNPPAGWTTQTRPDQLIIANDNIIGAEPFAIIILRGTATTDKPEIAFKKNWQQFFSLADTATTPRPRRLYNADGIAMYQSAMEMTLNNEKLYYVLTMYYHEKYNQCIVFKTTSAKFYKSQQADWMDRLQRVTFLKN